MNPNIVPLCKTIFSIALGLNNFQLGGRGIQGERNKARKFKGNFLIGGKNGTTAIATTATATATTEATAATTTTNNLRNKSFSVLLWNLSSQVSCFKKVNIFIFLTKLILRNLNYFEPILRLSSLQKKSLFANFEFQQFKKIRRRLCYYLSTSQNKSKIFRRITW